MKVGDRIRANGTGWYFKDGETTEVLKIDLQGDIWTNPRPGDINYSAGSMCEKASSFTLVELKVDATGKKFDGEKTPLELLSVVAMEGTAKVLQFGAKKYSANNWRGGISWTRLIGACLRHLYAYIRGEDLDKETGLPHIDHLACEVMFLQEFYRTKKNLDDRFKISVDSESKITDTNKQETKG